MIVSGRRLDEVAALVNRVIDLDQGKSEFDDRVADQIGLVGVLLCYLKPSRPDSAFAEPSLSGISLTARTAVSDGVKFRVRTG